MVDDTGFAKDCDALLCATRQYSGMLGKAGNCQVAVGVHAVTGTASSPLSRRLFLQPQRAFRRCGAMQPFRWEDTRAESPTRRRRLGCLPSSPAARINRHTRLRETACPVTRTGPYRP
ncbi:transposase [Nocardia nepalensis]|uniref:transposase n=1 Tax=Nocardia nepalensis TaxID=3375448 RepID=UPI003B685779